MVRRLTLLARIVEQYGSAVRHLVVPTRDSFVTTKTASRKLDLRFLSFFAGVSDQKLVVDVDEPGVEVRSQRFEVRDRGIVSE